MVSIKSVNLEFVRHSLLTRKVIKIEKRIETIESDHAPKVLKIKKNFRISRVCSDILIKMTEISEKFFNKNT